MIRFMGGAAMALLTPLASAGQAHAQAAPLQLTALPVEAVRPLVAEGFCFVAGVDRNLNGVAVHFNRRVRVIVTQSDGGKSFYNFDPAYRPRTDDADGSVLYLEPNADFTIVNTPEDTCGGKVTREGGKLGVRMDASVFILDRMDKSTRFLPAQPTDAHVSEKSGRDYEFYAALPAEAARIRPLKAAFDKHTRQMQRQMAKIAHEQGTERAEVNLPPMVTLSHHETTKVMGSNPRFLSMLVEAEMYTGGAHGVTGYEAQLWDREKNALRKSGELFSDGMAALRTPWCDALDTQREEAEVASAGQWRRAPGRKYLGIWDCPDLDELSVVLMGQPGQPFDRIRLIAAPYVAGPYSDGTWTVTFPVTAEVIALVKPEYRGAFRVHGEGDRK